MAQRQALKSRMTPSTEPGMSARAKRRCSKKTLIRDQSFTADQFRLMIDAVTDYAIYMLDPEGHIVSWNPGAQRLKGYSASEVIGKHYSMFFTNDDIKAGKPQRELEQAKREGRFEDEGWRVRKIGPQFWANVVLTPVYNDGVLRGYVKVTRNLTERKIAEDALRQSEEWLRTTLQSIGDAVMATDVAGNVKFLNPVAESLTGWKQDEAKGLPLDRVFVIVNQETRIPVRSRFKVVSSGRVVGLANHTVLIARDHTEHVIADSAAPIISQNQEIIGVVIVFRKGTLDETDHRRL
jgi:PAS domain S-box-containing protein